MPALFSRAAVAVTAVVIGLLGAASAADAVVRTTTYYTINLKPPTPSSPHQLLGIQNQFSGDQVRVKAAGDTVLWSTEWTRVNLEWPGFAPVTGHGPLEGITNCTFAGCPFTGHAEVEVKFVNRLSGKCLTLADGRSGTITVQSTCAASGHSAVEQVWGAYGAGLVTGGVGSPLEQIKSAIVSGKVVKQPRCLSPVPPTDHRTNTPVGGVTCHLSTRFFLVPVAHATCEIGVTNDICGPRRG